MTLQLATFPGALTVTVVSKTADVDAYGDSTPKTPPPPPPRTIDGCLIAPRSSTERVDPQQPAVITAKQLYGPQGTMPPDSDDLIRVDTGPHKGTYAVEGEAGDWGLGWEAALKRWKQP